MPAPRSTEAKFPASNAVIAAVGDWARKRRAVRQDRQHLDECGSYELARIGRDVGLSSLDLRRMAVRGADAARLLIRRLTALHLDADTLVKSDMSVMRDLQRLCSACRSKGRCKRDLARDPDNPAWRQYCPNAGTLDALQSGDVNVTGSLT
jgi:hypothetical protein